MGKKTRTRRTKWRRLSLGEASGPEEEDDEIQQTAEDLTEDVVVVLHSADDLSVDEHFVHNQDSHPDSTVADGGINCNTSGQEQQQHKSDMMVSNQQPNNNRGPTWKLPANNTVKNGGGGGYYNVNNGYPAAAAAATRPAGAAAANNNNFRRNNGPRYNSSFNSGGGYNGGANSYGRANSWNSSAASSYNGDHHHHHHQQPAGKMHGIEKKIFNDEEYTKISTPRQEVLFKKGSIGAKKRTTTPTTTTAANDSEQDSVNGNAASPIGESETFQYSGNDSNSTGDASSTAGEAPDAAAAAAAATAAAVASASGAPLQPNYDGTPLVCFPMYDFYGGYGGMYPGSMLVQTYPGGPIVAAVPVPVPVQPIDWYRGAAGGAGAAAAANGTAAAAAGEVAYYYALGYPAGGEIAAQTETTSSSRRNSLESYQASSQEVTTGSEVSSSSSSENSSPCSTGPSSQGPASPQGELVSPSIDPKAQTGGGAAAAAAAVVMDMTMDSNRKMTVANFGYPLVYSFAPPLYATGSSVCDPNSYYYDDSGQVVYYEQYDDEAMDVNADGPEDESLALDVQQLDWYRPDEMARDGAATAEEEEEDKRLATGGGEDETMMTPSTTTTTTLSNPIAPAGTGRRKKRRKKRNKTRSERASQPRVTDDGAAAEDEEDEDDDAVAATAEKEVIPAACISLAEAVAAAESSDDPSLETHPHHSSLFEISAPLSSRSSPIPPPPSPTTTTSLKPESTNAELPSSSSACQSVVECHTEPLPPPLHCVIQQSSQQSLSLPESSVDSPETPGSPVFCSTPSCLTAPSIPPTFAVKDNLLPAGLSVILAEEEPINEQAQLCGSTDVDPVPSEQQQQEKSSNRIDEVVELFNEDVEQLLASDHQLPEEPLLPASREGFKSPSDSIEEDSLASSTAGQEEEAAKSIDRDSLDGDVDEEQRVREVDKDVDNEEEDGVSSSDDFVYLQLDEQDDAPDGYFDDEPDGLVSDPALLLQQQRQQLHAQLWRTVILEESEPNSKEMSPLLCSDSGIVAGTPSPPASSVAAGADHVGPITKAVSRWLESAPIQQQLIASTTTADDDEEEEDNSSDDDGDIYNVEDDIEQLVTVPKNVQETLRIAPSSDDTDGPLRRVDSVSSATGRDLPLEDEEPPVQPLTQHCDPAKYSVYYQLGVSVDQDDEESGKLEESVTIHSLDDGIQQCPAGSAATTKNKDKHNKRRNKRNSWRRVLLLHRAVHNKSKKKKNKSDSSSSSTDILKTSRRLKSSQSCCALQ